MGTGVSAQGVCISCVRKLYVRVCDYHISGDLRSKFSEVIMMISLLVAITSCHYCNLNGHWEEIMVKGANGLHIRGH